MALTGMWLTGLESALPAAGVVARLYFATDTSRIFLDIGAAWVRLNLIPRGTYAGGTIYYEKDLVTYNGSVWRALATVTGVTPVEGANWTLFVSKGDTGTTSGAAGGDLSGTYPNPQIATGVILDADVNASAAIAESKLVLASDAAAGTASRRTLGTSATSAAAGNDSRLSNARTPTAHTTSHDVGGSDPVQRFIEKDFIFQGTLPTVNGTTTGTLRVPIIVSATIVAITVTINALPVGAGSSQTLDLLRSGTTVYTTAGNRPSFVPGGSQFITATLPDVTALTGGTHYLTANLVTAGTPSSGGSSVVMTVRYRQ